jgi:hypothetical protein
MGLEFRMKETTDAPKIAEIDNRVISDEARQKFDQLMGDDKLPENPAYFQDKQDGLTDKEKEFIKKEKGWSDVIVDNINSFAEYEIYKNAGLTEAEINGKKCLIRGDINCEQKDSMGRSNKERAEKGLPPLNKDGKIIELHHIGQHSDSPLAELLPEEHRMNGNDTILHDKQKETEIDRQEFAKERSAYWEVRARGGNDE